MVRLSRRPNSFSRFLVGCISSILLCRKDSGYKCVSLSDAQSLVLPISWCVNFASLFFSKSILSKLKKNIDSGLLLPFNICMISAGVPPCFWWWLLTFSPAGSMRILVQEVTLALLIFLSATSIISTFIFIICLPYFWFTLCCVFLASWNGSWSKSFLNFHFFIIYVLKYTFFHCRFLLFHEIQQTTFSFSVQNILYFHYDCFFDTWII